MDTKKFLLNTDYNNQKIWLNQTISFSATYPFTDLTVPHDLGYLPSARVWIESDSGNWYPLTTVQAAGTTPYEAIEFIGNVAVDTANVYIHIDNSSGSTATKNIVVRVYLDD